MSDADYEAGRRAGIREAQPFLSFFIGVCVGAIGTVFAFIKFIGQ